MLSGALQVTHGNEKNKNELTLRDVKQRLAGQVIDFADPFHG